MGVLIFIFFALVPFSAQAASLENLPLQVIFDAGNPEASVGVIGEEVLEMGAFYSDFQVVAFDPEGIILKDKETAESLKWLKEGIVSPKVLQRAQRFFVVKQMRAIAEAQRRYLEKFQDHYADNLNTLIDQGFLADGFQEGQKQGYFFKILQSGLGKRLAIEAKRLPEYFAAAEPLDSEQNPWFFGVDQLGQVRYAKSLRAVTWGPVWEYNNLNEEPPSTVITYEGEP